MEPTPDNAPVQDGQPVTSSEARVWVETLATLVGDDPSATVERYLGANGNTPDLPGIIAYANAHSDVLARRLRPENIAELSAGQRAALEHFLAYLEYIDDIDEEGVDRDERLRRALGEYSEDHDGNPVASFIQEIILIIARMFGLEEQARGIMGMEAPEPQTAPTETAPLTTEPVLGEQRAIPAGGENGRYRLMTVARDSGRGILSTEMVLVAADGTVAARYDMRSGGGGRGSLPGLDDTDSSRPSDPITAEYRINWDDVRTGRRERGMRYSDGSPGYSFTIENPSNLAAIGGAGRDYFRIHPQGNGAGTAGCLEFVNDDAGRHFYRMMMSLPESQRPQNLEVLNPNNLQPANSRLAFAQVDSIEDISAPSLAGITRQVSELLGSLRPSFMQA